MLERMVLNMDSQSLRRLVELGVDQGAQAARVAGLTNRQFLRARVMYQIAGSDLADEEGEFETRNGSARESIENSHPKE
jgi:hypothetical protein